MTLFTSFEEDHFHLYIYSSIIISSLLTGRGDESAKEKGESPDFRSIPLTKKSPQNKESSSQVQNVWEETPTPGGHTRMYIKFTKK